MVWRDLLERGTAAGTELAKARRIRIAAQILLAAGLVFATLGLRSFFG